jgi:hypothetical protein
MKNNIILLEEYLKNKKINKKLIKEIIKYNSLQYAKRLEKIEFILNLTKELNLEEVKELMILITNKIVMERSSKM